MPIIKARSSSIISSVDLRGTPTVATAASGVSTTQIASTAFVRTAVAELINAAPETLDTLQELAAALGDDPDFAATVTTALGEKLDIAGGTMTGSLYLVADPLTDLEAATKRYVDESVSAITINSTDDVPEGIDPTRLYFSEERVRSSISLTSTDTDVLSYNSITGGFTYNHPTTDGILEGVNNEYYTDAKVHGAISLNSDNQSILGYNGTSGLFTFVTPNTDQISEEENAINLWFTTARARDAFTAGANINISGGVISTQAAVWSVNGYDHDVTLATDDISDVGQNNKYFTDAQARNAVSVASGSWDLYSYDASTGEFTLTAPNTYDVAEDPEATVTSGTMYFTQGRARSSISATGWKISYNSTTGVITMATPNTSDVAEDPSATVSSGTMYFTQARARAAVSAVDSSGDGSFSYDSETGVFTYTGPSAAEARAHFSAVDAGGDGSFSYADGVFTYTGPSATEVRAHLSGDAAKGVNYDSATGLISLASVPNTVLANSSITINSYATALGGSVTLNTDDLSDDGRTNQFYHSSLFDADLATKDTSDVAEDPDATVSSGTMYFTNARARAAVSAVDAGGDGSFSYNSTTGAFTYTGPSAAEARAHFSAVDASGDGSFSYDSVTGAFTYTGPSATEARAHFSAVDAGGDGSFSYDSATGAFTYTGPSAAEVRAHFSGGTGVTITNGVVAIGQSVGTTDDVTFGTVTATTFTGALDGNASTATALLNAQNFSASGDVSAPSVSFDGTGAVTLVTTLATVNANVGTFGSASAIPIITVNAKGLITSVTTASSSSIFDIAGDTGTDSVDLTTDTLTFAGTANEIVTAVTDNTVTFSLPADVTIANDLTVTNDLAVSGDATITGSLTVNGTLTTISSNDLVVTDKNITIADGAANAAAADGAGITVDGANATLTYSSATDSWNVNKDFNISGDLSANNFDGNLSGNVSGDVTSTGTSTFNDVTVNGTLTGNVSGDLTGDVYATNGVKVLENGTDGTDATFTGNVNGDVSGNAGTVTSLAGHDTSEIAEDPAATVSSGTMYFTNARARAAVSATDAGGDGSFSYNSATGVFTYTGPSAAETQAHFSAVDAGGDGSFSYADGVFTYTGPSATEVRAHLSAVDAGGDGSFSYADGVFTYTGPSATEVRAHLSATTATGVTYNNTTGVIALSAIPNSSLENSDVTINTYSLSLGGSLTLVTDDIDDASSTNKYYASSLFDADLATKDTTDLAEDPNATVSSGTMYFTNARARAAVSAVDNGGDGSFNYNSTTGIFTYTGPSAAEVRAHLSAVDAGGDGSFSYDSETGAFTYTGPSAAEVRAHLSAGTGIAYNSSTGVISTSSIPNASLVNSSVTFNGTTVALGGSGSFDTSAVAEDPAATVSSGTMYFTNARVWDSLTVTTDNSDALSYDSATGTFTFDLSSVYTDEIAEDPNATVTSGTMYFTNQRVWDSLTVTGSATFNSATGTLDVTGDVESVNGQVGVVSLDTDDVPQGASNKYFTNALAQQAITLDSDDTAILSYSAGTFTFRKQNTDQVAEEAGATNLWYTDARADARIAAASVFDLSDVDSGTMTDGYTLVWSSAESAFVPQNIAVSATTLNFTGDGSTTSFNTGVEVSSIENTAVFINGLVQAPTYSYTLTTTNGETSIVFDSAPESNDYIMVRVTSTSQLTASGVLNENSTVDGGTF